MARYLFRGCDPRHIAKLNLITPKSDGTSVIARHVDQRRVPTDVVEAIGDQVMHTLLAHVAERHRRAGWVLELHSMTSSARASS
jgi:hypothetical protein